MAKGFNAGSVNAKINLDNSQFDEKIKEVVAQAKKATEQINASSKNTEGFIDNLVKSTQNLKAQQNELYGSINNTSESIKSEAENLKNLSQQSKKAEKEINKVKKAKDELNRSLKFKDSKFYTKEDEEFLTELVKAIDKAEKINGRVKAKPIFDQLESQFPDLRKHYTNIDDYKKYWTNALTDIRAYFGSVVGYGKEVVDLGKHAKFNTINVENVLTVEELAKSFKEIKDETNQVTDATDKLTTAEKKLENQTKKTIDVNKKLASSLKATNPHQQAEFNRQLYGYLDAMSDPTLGVGSKSVDLKHLREYGQFFIKEAEELDKYISNAMHALNAPIRAFSKDNISFDIRNIKKPLEEVAETAEELKSEIKEVDIEEKKVVETTKEVSDNLKELTNSEESSISNTKQLKEETKQLGEVTKETNAQLLTEKQIMNALGSETFNYISNLKRGRTSKGVVGTDSALWKRYNGMTGRAKVFDLDKYVNHMKRIFKGVLPDDLFEKEFAKFSQRFKIGQVPPFGGEGGIKEGYWNQIKYYEGLSSVKELKQEILELGKAEEATTIKTEQLFSQITTAVNQANQLATAIEKVGASSNEIDIYKAQLMGLANLLKSVTQVKNRYTEESNKIINSLSAMARANEEFTGSAEKIRRALKNIAKLKEWKYNFGFSGKDAFDTHFMQSTLDELMYGTVHGSGRIVPKDKELRRFSDEEKKFAESIWHATAKWDDATNKWVHKIIPANEVFTRDFYWGEEGNWARRLGDTTNTDTKEGKKIAKQTAQAVMGNIFDYLGIELIEATGRGGHRFYDPLTGGTKGILSIDASALDNYKHGLRGVIDAMDKAIDSTKLLEMGEKELHRDMMKINTLADHMFQRIPEEKRELLDVCKVADELTEKATKYYNVRKAIANKDFTLGGKTNYDAMAKDLERLIKLTARSDLQRRKVWSNNFRTFQNMKEYRIDTLLPTDSAYDNAQFKPGALYIRLGDILSELHRKYGIVIKDASTLKTIIERTDLAGHFFGNTRYFPTTSELVDLLGSSFMEAWSDSIQQGELGFRNLMTTLDEIKPKVIVVADSMEKTTQANEKNIESTKKVIEVNKQLVASMKEVDLETQILANRLIYSYLAPYNRPNNAGFDPYLEMAKFMLPLRLLGDEAQTIVHNALQEMNVGIKKISNTVDLDVTNLKKPILDISEVTDRVTASTDKLTESVERNTLSYKENLAVREAMYTEALGFLSKTNRVKDGNLNDVFGKDGARWVKKGLLDEDFRVRMFDLERFREHIEKSFKGIIPIDQLKQNMADLEKEFDINRFVGGFGGIYDYEYTHLQDLVNGATKSLEELKQEIIGTTEPVEQLVSETNKVAEASNNVISAKKREAEEFKKYTLHEIGLMETWNRQLKHKVVDGISLVPLDNKRYGKDENYSSILGTVRRTHNHVNRGYSNDSIFRGEMFLSEGYENIYSETASFIQSRIKDLLHDLNITISDITDNEFKKIRSKLSGKMVEYLDISKLSPEVIENNEKWLKKVKDQLISFKRFEKEFEKIYSIYSSSGLYDHKIDELRELINSEKQRGFKNYGYEGNPFVKEFLRTVDVKEDLRAVASGKGGYEVLYINSFLESATEGLTTLNRLLNTTKVDLKNMEVGTRSATEAVERLTVKSHDVVEAEKKVEVQTKKVTQAVEELPKIKLSNIFGGEPNNAIENMIFGVEERLNEVSALTSKILKDGSKLNSEMKQSSQTVIDYKKSSEELLGEIELLEKTVVQVKSVAESLGTTFEHIVVSDLEFIKSLDMANRELELVSQRVEKTVVNVKALSEEYRKVSNEGNIAGISMYQQFKNIIPAVIKAREELIKLGEAQQLPLKLMTGNNGRDINGIAKTPQRYLNLFKGQIGNIKPYINNLESRATKAFNKIKEEALHAEEEISKLPMVIEQVSDSFEKAGESASKSAKKTSEEYKKAYEETNRRNEEFHRKQEENRKKFFEQEKKRFYQQHHDMGAYTLDNYKNIFQQLNAVDKRLEQMYGRNINSRNLRMPRFVGEYNFVEFGKNIAHSTTALKTFDNTVIQTANDVYKYLYESMKKIYELNQKSKDPLDMTNTIKQWKSVLSEVKAFELRYTALMNRMYELSRKNYMSILGDKKNTGYGAILEEMAMKPIYEWVKVGDVWKRQFQGYQKTIDEIRDGSLGRVHVEGYSDYVARINEIKQALEGASGSTTKYQESLKLLAEAIKLTANELTGFVGKSEGVIHAMTQMAQANEKFAKTKTLGQKVTDLDTMLFGDAGLKGKGLGAVSGLTATLEHFSGLSNKHADTLAKFKQEATALADSFKVLNESMSKGAISSETYEKEIDELTEKVRRLKAEAEKGIREATLYDPNKLEQTNKGIKKNTDSVREFGKQIGQSERYADTLYRGLQKVRSVIISFKTIGRMFGGMAVWNFGFDLIESAKETYKAKNEIESLLEKNDKVDASGIQVFNQALDETVERFQKVNKYSLGETASSIGLEFNLSAQEMAKSLPIIAMIQSEYVRAGRTVEEAGLAVKDILQGEFMRLSRETGVGKEELIDAGWSGDNKDVISLMEALDKIGKARHWDLFAEKATSLNDVLTITKSRFAELGAEIGTTAEPLIVGSFNAILGAIDGLKQGFEGLGSFGKYFTLVFGGAGAIVGASSLYLALAKDMGILDIATIGWGKSLASSVLHLNKADVALHGFWKTLLGTISGVDTATVSNMGFTKSLVGRVLGLNQTVIAEKGFGQAITEHVIKMREGIDISKEASHSEKVLASLRREGITLEQSLAKKKGVVVNLDKASVLTMDKSKILTKEIMNAELTRSQRLAMLTKNIDYSTAKELSRGKALLKTATSAKVLKTALFGLTSITAVAWFAGIATWTDTVRKRMEAYNDVIQNGEAKIKNAQRVLDRYKQKLDGLSETDPEYNLTKSNAEVAERKLEDIQMAKKYADQIQKTSKEVAEANDLMISGGLEKIYAQNGVNIEKQGKNYLRMKYVAYDIQKAEEERYNFEYASLQHINEHLGFMKEANASEEQRLKYITEYSTKAEEVAENLKKFNEGDLTAGIYYVLGRLQLMWIDLWNDSHFIAFWDSVNKTWRDLKPTVTWLIQSLGDLGHILLDFFSTQQGQIVGGVGAVTLAIAGIAYKIAPSIKKLKEFASTLKDVLSKLKVFNKDSDKGKGKDKDKSPKDKTPTPDIPKPSDVGLKEGLIKDFKGNVRNYANYATQLAGMMVLITEAIWLIQAPMWALAETGKTFKAKEKSIRAGIEGLQLVAPTVLALLVPVLALVKVFDYFGDVFNMKSAKTLASAVIGIAVGIGLVAETIFMLQLPMATLASLGNFATSLGDSVQKGTQAMKEIGDSLQYLAPFIAPVALGIALVGIAFAQPEVGLILFGAVALGIPVGMALLAETILSLYIPLMSISALGATVGDLSGVKQGAEAIKTCAEAMKYVEEATRVMALVHWEVLATNIADVISQLMGHNIGEDLVKLTEQGGFLDKMEEFAKGFNGKTFTPIDPSKAEALKTVGESLNAVNGALESAKTAIQNLPQEFKDGQDSLVTGFDAKTGQKTVTPDTQGYFDQLKKPLEELGKFVDWFNNTLQFPTEGVSADKIAIINQSADMVTQVNNAVSKVKEAMGNIAMGNVATGLAQATSNVGMFGFGITNPVAGMVNSIMGGGQGDYQSSIGGQLYEMEMVLKDLAKFNSNVASIGGGQGNGDASGGTSSVAQGLTDMVTAVGQAISQLESTLSQAVPNIKQNANNIGTGIRDGVKTGLGELAPLIIPPLVSALTTAKAYAGTYGKGIGYQLKSGFQSTAKLKETAEAEVNYTITYLDGKKQDFYNKGAELGDALARGFKEHGLKQESPGLMARTTLQEMYYILDSLDTGMTLLPEKAIALGEVLSSNFNPSLDVGGLSVDDLGQFESGLNVITATANDTNLQTSTAFNSMGMTVGTTMQGMTTSINGTFNNIKQNATTSYAQLTNTTRNSLRNMQSQTTKNIGAIRQSWREMQNALIASAENIRSQTSEKIRSLESNMASFWQKIQNPANLLAGGTSVGHHTRIRNSSRRVSKPATAKLMAGSPKIAGGSNNYKISQISLGNPAHLAEYLSCLLRDGTCMAGNGWNFDWSKDIQDTFMKWDTHFNKFNLDSYLKVGKFENDDFPVRGIKDLALDYIEDAISQTTYEHYYNEKYSSPLEAWNAGHFNCVDGARVAIALASAFGFGGGGIRYTTWDGEGHGYAYIPELGVIDATAIQGGYGLKAGKVSYASGSRTINSSKGRSTPPKGDIIVNITVNIEGDVDNAKEKGKEIGEEINKRIMNVLKRSPHTGL